MRKNYILDANILIHDPNSLLQFADNTVIIPVGVIGELDRFKKEQTPRGYNARAVVRLLDSLRGDRSLASGVPLESGGDLRVFCEPDRLFQSMNGGADAEILRVAQAIQQAEPERPTVIVSKDINLRIRADAAGLRAEDYETDRVDLAELYSGHRDLTLSAEEFTRLHDTGETPLNGHKLSPNEYTLVRAGSEVQGTQLARADVPGERLTRLIEADQPLWGIKPRNKEQYFAIDALLNERISLVTLMGKAGTGKTLFALAAALHLTFQRRKFRNILVCRPIFPVGRDIGYLPGDIGQKLDPWLKPISDTIEFLLDLGGPVKNHSDCDSLIRDGLIEIQPLTYIRGRSLTNRFVIIDESQNLTPLEMKTIITRVGQGSKIVLTGDTYQIDNPYIDATSNGFTYLVNRFRAESIAAHVELRKGERSALAELAANLL